MKRKFSSRVRTVIIVAVVLSVLLAVAGSAFQVDIPGIIVKGILQPIQAGAQAITNQAEEFYDYMFRYEALVAENAELKEWIAELEKNARSADALERENDRYRAALSLQESREDFEMVDASIIGWDSTDWSSACTVSRGSNAGIEVGQCAITANGEVVGLVTEVGVNYAVVKTVLDSSLEVSASIASSGYNGMVQGGYATGQENMLRMNYLPSDAVIRNNDQVVTAGSTMYPRDLILGYVVDAGYDETGVAKYAILEPAADFGSLEQIFILTSYSVE